ncbi:cysteine-rich receptor-like protein kinase 2 [Cynara cardunculus var. scolymus]|uniref:cysteine-rich receptor-like protein kinase 2 n=1 Tax=Cynara cardunculus var. scolymus TaxID=59895 RepID=UPI000D62B3DC|nr:cysteine-rich receptor-like protein kinase 2 [Cynara cardunculus var. scolymus]
MAVLVLLLVLLMVNPGISQSNNSENDVNTPIRSFCGRNRPIVPSNFINNRNSTFTAIRRQLSNNNVFYARAQSLLEGDSVFGVTQCRNYLSTSQCMACFDAGVSRLLSCITGNGAYVFFDNCFVRYENYDDFYDDPNVVEDAGITPLQICGNQSTSHQPTTMFREVVDGLLLDIKDATPKTSNFYVASTRQITSGNAMVYSIAQCVENTSQTVCQTCLNTIYTYLYNCLPNTEGRSINMGCFARYSETPFFNDNQTIDITSFLKGHSSKVSIIAGAIGGTVGLLFILIVLWFLLRLRKKSKKSEEDSPDLKGAINYNYKDLQLATNNFSEKNILGKGGFGEVFKAILDDNNTVAVKKIEVAHAKAKEEFENEVKLVSNVHHRNLLRLLGWSSEGSHLLLVLEYMPNGSLDKFLWGAKRGTLNWKQRYDIILGIAKGLAHLHDEFHVKIVHRDIKSSNILLDDDLQPKIADFGLARFQPEDQSHISTKFAGTLGYTAPEYALRGLLSDKVDTYSFGIVILEIISGQRCTDTNSDRPSMDYLLEHAWKLYENKKHIKFIDETLDVNQSQEEHVMHIIEIALLCTQSPVSKRPTMSEVRLMLSTGQSLGKIQLTRPTLIDQDRRIQIGSSNKAISLGKVSGMPKELEANEQLHGEKAYEKVDVMEKGMNVATTLL